MHPCSKAATLTLLESRLLMKNQRQLYTTYKLLTPLSSCKIYIYISSGGSCGRGLVGGLPLGTATVTWVGQWELQVGTVGTAALGLRPRSPALLIFFVFPLLLSAHVWPSLFDSAEDYMNTSTQHPFGFLELTTNLKVSFALWLSNFSGLVGSCRC